ncbi:MAG: 30S ribosomal protein S8 [Candidatus Burarchaeum sp.]|nr:30S ribosomal protein S8 [Candidatus Burarchaeum sp.]MDO8339374.1 30S ribosomal protein S8 [Candidatus Burarchaeum sp.]
MVNDPLADALNTIKTHEIAGKPECTILPASKIVREVLLIFQRKGYIGEMEFVDNGTSGAFEVQLVGKINSCGTIKPRFAVKKTDWNKWEQRYIPSKDFGLLIVSTPKGMMTNSEAKDKNTGGRLIAYVY